jgi:signal transduction histidine kinase
VKQSRILVVDDDAGLLILMAEVLKAEGYEVATAESGAVARHELSRNRPDLLLLDLKLKDVGGPELLHSLRHDEGPVPFVVVTGQGDEKIAVEMMKQGALDYVMKDTGLLDLLPAVVKRALSVVEQDRALAVAQAESRRLEGEMIAVGEGERRRIGADLHDGLGQQLTAIELYCAALKADAERTHPELAARLKLMGRMLREAIAQTRSLARGLVPIGDDPDALRIGLAELAERTSAIGPSRCTFECPDPVPFGERSIAGHLYRIAQEAVNNAVKHSRAAEIVIELSREGSTVRLRISDNGRGLSRVRSRGLGLKLMRYRASVIGGRLEFASRKDHGFSIECTVPVPP